VVVVVVVIVAVVVVVVAEITYLGVADVPDEVVDVVVVGGGFLALFLNEGLRAGEGVVRAVVVEVVVVEVVVVVVLLVW
jgi:hypothetical protein